MSTVKTILVHGLMAAGVLAIIGYFLAQLAGMWVATQSQPRVSWEANALPIRDAGIDTTELTATLAWRLPLSMAAFGFILVAIGEGLRSIWKTQPPQSEPQLTESETQRMLRDQETARISQPEALSTAPLDLTR